MTVLSDDAEEHYSQIDESARLDRLHSRVEKIRTQELMSRYLPAAPADIADVGGAAGVHAFWLAERGYTVTLIDAVEKHIERARSRTEASGRQLAAVAVGDARRLDLEPESFDGVLLFGPLYHLTDRGDRIAALREAFRVLRPGGVLQAVGISRFASTLNLLRSGELRDDLFVQIAENDRTTGQHRNPTGDPGFFTTSFWHHPDELRGEVVEAGFGVEELLAVEGPARFTASYEENWEDDETRERLLVAIRQLEAEVTLLGASTHIMAVGRKP